MTSDEKDALRWHLLVKCRGLDFSQITKIVNQFDNMSDEKIQLYAEKARK